MSFLVDTNVFSELAETEPDAQVVAWMRNHEQDLYVSTITIGEIRRGIERLPSGKRKTALQSWLSGLCKRMEGRVLSYNTAVANVWGQLLVLQIEKAGLMLSRFRTKALWIVSACSAWTGANQKPLRSLTANVLVDC